MGKFDRGIVFKEQEVIVKHTLYTDGTSNTIAMGKLVRCRDCGYWNDVPASTAAPAYHECKARPLRIHTTADEFCSRGERRDGEQS